jgi:hypothetical protein
MMGCLYSGPESAVGGVRETTLRGADENPWSTVAGAVQ